MLDAVTGALGPLRRVGVVAVQRAVHQLEGPAEGDDDGRGVELHARAQVSRGVRGGVL